jgi:hypothetical protein
MKTELRIDFMWIPSDLGGHNADPYSGMRLSIRWQRHLEAYLQCARDVECQLVAYDSSTSRGRAVCTLSAEAPVPAEWLQDGQLVELLNGFRVLAVGRITSR